MDRKWHCDPCSAIGQVMRRRKIEQALRCKLRRAWRS